MSILRNAWAGQRPMAVPPRADPLLMARLVAAGRRSAVPRSYVELMAQDPDTARGFVGAVGTGQTDAFLSRVDWDALEAALAACDRFAPGAGRVPPI